MRKLEIENAYFELKNAELQIVQQEKMASIGQLAAGVAHEINNPLGFMMSNINMLKNYFDKLSVYLNLQGATIEQLKNALQVSEYKKFTNNVISTDVKENKKSLKIDSILGDLDDLFVETLDGGKGI